MKVAIYHNLPGGGAKRALFEMARRLAESHDLDVFTLSSAEHDFCDLRPFCNRHEIIPFQPLPLAQRPWGRLNQGIRAVDLLRLRALQKQLADHIDAAGYDVVFAHHCRFSQAPSILQFLETPAVYYCQEPPRLVYEPTVARPYAALSKAQRFGNLFDPFPDLYRQTLRRQDRASVLAASVVLVNSAFSRESLYRVYGILAHICYLGVDTERFRPLSLPKSDYVLSVGALSPLKGFDFLLQSLAEIASERRPPLRLVSNAEDTTEKAYLENLADRLGVQVEFYTRIQDRELVELYNQAMLTVYSPVMEPCGFVPLESMACGTPVVGVHEGGVRETIIDGLTGRLAGRDPQCFARVLESLIADPDLRLRLGQRAREHVVGQWSWERSAREVEGALEEVARGT